MVIVLPGPPRRSSRPWPCRSRSGRRARSRRRSWTGGDVGADLFLEVTVVVVALPREVRIEEGEGERLAVQRRLAQVDHVHELALGDRLDHGAIDQERQLAQGVVDPIGALALGRAGRQIVVHVDPRASEAVGADLEERGFVGVVSDRQGAVGAPALLGAHTDATPTGVIERAVDAVVAGDVVEEDVRAALAVNAGVGRASVAVVTQIGDSALAGSILTRLAVGAGVAVLAGTRGRLERRPSSAQVSGCGSSSTRTGSCSTPSEACTRRDPHHRSRGSHRLRNLPLFAVVIEGADVSVIAAVASVPPTHSPSMHRSPTVHSCRRCRGPRWGHPHAGLAEPPHMPIGGQIVGYFPMQAPSTDLILGAGVPVVERAVYQDDPVGAAGALGVTEPAGVGRVLRVVLHADVVISPKHQPFFSSAVQTPASQLSLVHSRPSSHRGLDEHEPSAEQASAVHGSPSSQRKDATHSPSSQTSTVQASPSSQSIAVPAQAQPSP